MRLWGLINRAASFEDSKVEDVVDLKREMMRLMFERLKNRTRPPVFFDFVDEEAELHMASIDDEKTLDQATSQVTSQARARRL